MSNGYVINDELLRLTLVEDLMRSPFDYTEHQAVAWVHEHAEGVVSDMWDAYVHYLENFTEEL